MATLSESSQRRLWLVGLLLVVAAVYARAAGYGMLPGFDDGLYLNNRPEVRDWWGASWWRRLVTPATGYGVAVPTFVYAHVKLAFPEGFPQVLHAVNIAGHLVNTVLVYLLVRRWEDDRLGLAVAALWGLHPACVETVAWLTNLKGILYGIGVLGTLVVWQRYLEREETGQSLLVTTVACFLLFLIALGSRPEAALLPVVMAWGAWRFRSLRESLRGLAAGAGPMLAVSAVYLPVAIRGQDEVVQSIDVGSVGLGRRLFRLLRALEVNVRNLFWPAELHPGYFLKSNETWVDAVPGGLILAGIAVLVAVLVARRDRRLLFPVGLGALFYAPYSQLMTLPRLAADSYLYLPGVAGMLAAVTAGDRLLDRAGELVRADRARRWAVVAFAAVFALLTALQVGRWRSNAALWGPILERYPRLWKPYYCIAREYMADKKWEKSAALLEKGLPIFRESRVYPSYIPMVFERVGQPRRALKLAFEAIRRDRNPRPSHYQVYLGVLARNDFPPPDRDSGLRWTRKAVRRFNREERWMKQRQLRMSLAAYFVRQQLDRLAVSFLEREFAAAQPDCAAWRLASRLEPSHRKTVGPPSKPERCTGDD